MRSRFLSILIAVMLCLSAFVVAPATAFAGTQGSCSGTDTSRLLLWENAIGDTSDGNDNLWKCGGDADLNNDSHTLPGDCNTQLIDRANWNDCVSSVTVWVPSGYVLCFYGNANYTNSEPPHQVGPKSNYRFNLTGLNDGLSSFKYVAGSSTIVCAA